MFENYLTFFFFLLDFTTSLIDQSNRPILSFYHSLMQSDNLQASPQRFPKHFGITSDACLGFI